MINTMIRCTDIGSTIVVVFQGGVMNGGGGGEFNSKNKNAIILNQQTD